MGLCAKAKRKPKNNKTESLAHADRELYRFHDMKPLGQQLMLTQEGPGTESLGVMFQEP